MIHILKDPAATVYNFGTKHESLPTRVVNWLAGRDNHKLNTHERIVQWISIKVTGKDPYARSGFEKGCTIAKNVAIVVGSGLAVAGGLYLAGKGLETLGTNIANEYRGKVPVAIGSSLDGKPLCELTVMRRGYKHLIHVKETVNCDVVKRAYETNVTHGENMSAFGQYLQTGAKHVFAGVTVPFYTAYALPKKLFSMMPTELPWVGKLPEVNIGQRVNDLFAITTSAAEALFGKL
jgi:hypothetical protein